MSFQYEVNKWMIRCFGLEISKDKTERNHRFLEESLELVQSCGCTASEAHQLVDYVFNRPVGEIKQEVGGVMVTLAALCTANGCRMMTDGNVELDRINKNIEAIREKQANKPEHSPLPERAMWQEWHSHLHPMTQEEFKKEYEGNFKPEEKGDYNHIKIDIAQSQGMPTDAVCVIYCVKTNAFLGYINYENKEYKFDNSGKLYVVKVTHSQMKEIDDHVKHLTVTGNLTFWQ